MEGLLVARLLISPPAAAAPAPAPAPAVAGRCWCLPEAVNRRCLCRAGSWWGSGQSLPVDDEQEEDIASPRGPLLLADEGWGLSVVGWSVSRDRLSREQARSCCWHTAAAEGKVAWVTGVTSEMTGPWPWGEGLLTLGGAVEGWLAVVGGVATPTAAVVAGDEDAVAIFDDLFVIVCSGWRVGSTSFTLALFLTSLWTSSVMTLSAFLCHNLQM